MVFCLLVSVLFCLSIVPGKRWTGLSECGTGHWSSFQGTNRLAWVPFVCFGKSHVAA